MEAMGLEPTNLLTARRLDGVGLQRFRGYEQVRVCFAPRSDPVCGVQRGVVAQRSDDKAVTNSEIKESAAVWSQPDADLVSNTALIG